MITSVLSLAIVLQVYYNFLLDSYSYYTCTRYNSKLECKILQKLLQWKPSYSVTKTMKFITTFDTIHVQDTIENLITNLSGTSLAIAIVL